MARYAIGDVHGCARTLDTLLARLALAPDDHVVFVGDYVDRGPDSPGVIDRLLDLSTRVPCTFLRGNHDEMFLEALAGVVNERTDAWVLYNGGDATIKQYRKRRGMPAEHVDFLTATELVYDAPEAAYVHAGLDPYRSVGEQMAFPDPSIVLWSRDHLQVPASELEWEKPVVFGHTPQSRPLLEDRRVGIDTGCVYGPKRPQLGHLCAIRMEDRFVVLEPYVG